MGRKLLFCFLICTVVAGCRPSVRFSNNLEGVICTKGYRTIWLPIKDDAPEVSLLAYRGGDLTESQWRFNMADSTSDYILPFDVSGYDSLRFSGRSFLSPVWKKIRLSRKALPSPAPALMSFTPPYGWINDPNGMVWKDGVYHLFYQFNPLGAKWGNMTWGHAVSTDLVEWNHMSPALLPDSLGMVFSGSAVVDSDRLAAIYTSAGKRQVQSIAFSDDGGETFVKYSDNPVLESSLADFRDPKVFRYEADGRWRLILAAGDHMELYSSENLTDWSFENSFGQGYGLHTGVWECPDLFELRKGEQSCWVLVCSLDTGYPRRSATQYFLGSFDGRNFVPYDSGIRLLDYGTDHYAAVSWSGVPDGRRIILAWKNNWAYANEIPGLSSRGSMTLPRELQLGEYGGVPTVYSYPVREAVDAAEAGTAGWAKTSFILKRGSDNVVLPLDGGGSFMISLNGDLMTFDRSLSGNVDFSEKFIKKIDVPVPIKDEYRLDAFAGQNSVEIFVDDGARAVTMLTFQ